MRSIKLIVGTTIRGVFFPAGQEVAVDEGVYATLVRLGSCVDVSLDTTEGQKAVESSKPLSFGGMVKRKKVR